MSSRAHMGPWSPLDPSLRAYYQGPGAQSNSNANPRPAPRPQSARRPQSAPQNPQPGASSYSCNRFERFENRPVTRSWAKKLSELQDQTEVLLLLQFKKGNEAIDAFNRQCRRLGLYRKTDEMGSLERAAVDSAMVKGWEEFLWQWEEAGRLQAEEELRRQRQQQQQQRAAQRHAGRPQPRRQKTATRRPRNEPPETGPSASSPPSGQSSNTQANAGPSAPGGQLTSSSPPRGQNSSSSKTASAGPSGQGAQSPSTAHTSPTRGGSSNKQARSGSSTQQGQSQNPTTPSSTLSKPATTVKAGSSAQQAQSQNPASSSTQTAPLTKLQQLQQQVLNAQKDLDEKRQAWRAAITPPIRHRLSLINQLDQAQQNAQHALSSAQFQRDMAKRAVAAMAGPESFLDNLENPGIVDESQGEMPEEVQSQESTANPQPAQTKPAQAKPAPAKPAPAKPAQTKPAPAKPAPAKPAPARPNPTAPLTELQRHRQRVLDAQKDLDEKYLAYSRAVAIPRTLSYAQIDELMAIRDEAKAKLSKVQFEEDNARRAAAAAAMPGDPKENFTKLGSRPKSEWVIPEEVERNKVNTGPFSDPKELHQRVVRAQNFLNTCERSYDMNVKPPSRPTLRLVNHLNAELQQARDKLAKARLDEENGRRARAEEAKRVKALQGEIRRKATEQTTPQTRSSTANTTPAAPSNPSTTGPSFLAKLTANRLASAELRQKREAEAAAAANPTTYKRRKPLDDDLYLNLMKQKQKGKGLEGKTGKAKKEKMPGAFGEEEEEERRYREPTVEEVPDSAREEKMGKGEEKEGVDSRERIGPSPTIPKVDEEDSYSGE